VIVIDATVITTFILKEPGWSRCMDIVKNCYTVDHAVKEVSSAILESLMKDFISETNTRKSFKPQED
jgi:predicted nucleic acid-binding protein